MGKDKLKKIEIKYFLVPFLILALGFAALTYYTAKNRVEERYATLESTTLNIAESYSHSLANSREAYDIILELLDEKILVASQAIMLIEDKENNETLKEIAQKFNVDQVNLYNNEGEVIYSTVEEYIGWKANEGHPVYDFMVSEEMMLVEDIRPYSESGEYYKFGYVESDNGRFVQIGVLAENIHEFIGNFEITKLIDDISKRGDVKHVFFINSNYEIVASSLPKYIGYTIESEEVRKEIENDETKVLRSVIDDEEVFRVCVPIVSGNQKLGTLSIAWPADKINSEIREIVLNSILVFFIVVTTIGCILYYAYRKNKSNIKIAYYDKLTGLPNSEYLIEYLDDTINNLEKSKKAIMLLNCTNFKTINMTYGFLYGNKILEQIAFKVRNLIGPGDMFFRFDGDRFILVVEDYVDHSELLTLAQKLESIFENPFNNGTEHQYVNAEIAIVEIKDKDTSVDRVLQDASLTLSQIDRATKNPIRFFNEEMESKILRQEKIAKVLRAVIDGEDTDSFYLEFQPKLDLKRNTIIGFEALARIYTEELGQVSPFEFIAIAEEKLLIYDLGNQILLLAIEFMNHLRKQGYEDVGIAVNISGIQLLREEFLESVRHYIKRIDKNNLFLEFEITESVLIDEFDIINEKLEEIKKMGISISLDDFGTGFSSFSRLRELNIDAVKIDKYFINKISYKNEDDLITADIISMSHKIGLTVIAEGVEEMRQKEYLKEHGCDIIQGYLLSKPLPQNKAIEFLTDYNG